MQLVTFDLDGTLIKTTVFAAAGKRLGLADEISFFDDLFFRDLLSLRATFMAEYDLFLDRPVKAVQETLRKGPWLRGIQEGVHVLREAGLDVWVVTDQPDWATEVLADWGIEDGVWSTTRRWGEKIGPVDRFVEAKWPPLQEKLEAEGINPGAVCHVGNGSNDVPVFKNVGAAIAVNPQSRTVSDAADAQVQTDDLGPVVEQILAWR